VRTVSGLRKSTSAISSFDLPSAAGEADRRTRGAGGQTRRLLGSMSLGAFLAIAGYDEHGVVDAYREPQHHRQRAGRPRQAEGAGQGRDRGHADPDTEHRRQQRKTGSGHRIEGQHQHEGRDGNTDRLGRRARGRLTGQRVAADLDGQADVPDLVDGVLDGLLVGVADCGR
jgi:hypothetical protein